MKKIKLSCNVLAYNEPSIEDGKIFLFNAKEKIFWEGNSSAYKVIQCLSGNYISINAIHNNICQLYPDVDPEQIKDAVNSVIEDLNKKNFLEVKND